MRRVLRPICLLVCIATLWTGSTAYALDPARTISQYVHDHWGSDRGFVGGAVFAISQSADGYLWIGTERGLVRFDGFNFTLLQLPIPGSAAIGAVRGLVTDAEGSMWIRLDGPHLLRYRNGEFEDAYARFGLQEVAFTAITLDRDGELVVWGPRNRAQHFRHGSFSSYVISPDIPGIVLATAETQDRTLWLGTREIGLFRIDQGRTVNVAPHLAATSINALLPAKGDRLWIGTETGLKFWDGHKVVEPPLLTSIDRSQILALTGDRDGNVWVGTNHGLVRITPALSVSKELLSQGAGADVTAVYEDRDGQIWYGGMHGLERLRDGMFTLYSTSQTPRSENNGPVYVDSLHRTWFAPQSGGLYRMKDGQISHVTVAGLDKDVIYSFCGGGGEIWVGRQHGGLTVLTQSGESFASKTYTQAEGLAGNSVYSVHRNRDGTVWAGTVNIGLSRLKDGRFTNYSASNGFPSNAIFSIAEGDDGVTWFATPNGLASFAHERWKSYGTQDGLPSSNIRTILEDSKHVLWIATSGGLAMLNAGRIAIPDTLTDSQREQILGIAEDKQGSLWIVTADHVLQVNRDRLIDGSLTDADVLSYGTEDGLSAVEGVGRDRSIVADPDGRIWISLARGIAMADPSAAASHAAPVNVRMESISAGGIPIRIEESSKLAAGTHSIEFNYAASSLSNPQRVRFRYRLDGSDQGWRRGVPARQVVYTNLGPGSYQFRIQASNGIGPWNEPGTTIRFVVESAFWQAWWFRTICFLSCCLLIFAFYRWRISLQAHRLNVRFQDRLAERTRIAQDLHDTLLQGVLSASLQLDVAEDQIPSDSPAKPLIRRVLQLMSQITEEGRSALRGLRMPESDSFNLEISLSRLRQEFVIDEKTTYRVIAQGAPRPLRPLIRDDVYRIGREAVVNAFLHAHANNIEVEVEYANRYLRVWVRDDGRGMDPIVLKAGREGHWGLPGMRERSESIGSSLKLRSRVGAGTEVELTTPGTIAFDADSSGRISRWMPWLGQETLQTSRTDKRKRAQK